MFLHTLAPVHHSRPSACTSTDRVWQARLELFTVLSFKQTHQIILMVFKHYYLILDSYSRQAYIHVIATGKLKFTTELKYMFFSSLTAAMFPMAATGTERILVGDTRKTSNGCKVAYRVPRKQARFREPSRNIAAIVFGTAKCSLACATEGHSACSEEGPFQLPLNETYYCVPTAILFNPDGSVRSFGYDRRLAEYMDLDDVERLQYAYFEQIKMNLQHDEVRDLNARLYSVIHNLCM